MLSQLSLRNTIDYMVFNPLRVEGQGVILCLKTKSWAHCLVKGEKAGGDDKPTIGSNSPTEKLPCTKE